MQNITSIMPSEVMTAVQTELTTTADQVGLSTSTETMTTINHDEIIKSNDDKLTQAATDPADADETLSSPSSLLSSQIPVITSAEAKKKPYGGRPLRFQCPNCERRFHAPSHLKRHMLCHTSERPFQCHVCNKGFLQAWHLGRHMTTHTGNKPFNCPECPKTFGSRFEMKTHCNYIHRGIKEHECPICKKMFTLRSNLKVHMRKHTGEKPYECHACSKKFGQRGHLQYHLRKHEGTHNTTKEKQNSQSTEEQIIVDVEHEADSQITSYDSGVESVTSEYQASPKLRREESINSISESSPRSHMTSPLSRAIVYEKKPTSEVPLSGRMFDHTNPQELKPFVCVSCNCGFGEISSLRAHVRHSHLRKGIESGHFSCAHCNTSYGEIDALKKHFEENHKTQSYIRPRSPVLLSPVSPPLYERKTGEKYSYENIYDDYEPSKKRSLSQSMQDECTPRSPGGLSTSSDITCDRRPYIRKGFYMQCPSNCDCEYRSPSPPATQTGDSEVVQSRYLTYLEQYQKLLESHVELMEALQIYRKR